MIKKTKNRGLKFVFQKFSHFFFHILCIFTKFAFRNAKIRAKEREITIVNI